MPGTLSVTRRSGSSSGHQGGAAVPREHVVGVEDELLGAEMDYGPRFGRPEDGGAHHRNCPVVLSVSALTTFSGGIAGGWGR
jgi:hypothetical protein